MPLLLCCPDVAPYACACFVALHHWLAFVFLTLCLRLKYASQAAEKYAPSNTWYIRTMTTVFELGGDLVKPEVANNLMRLIAEGSGEDEVSSWT